MGAYEHMIQSNRRAAEILRAHGAQAATDVTGFGLLGHLIEMVRASDVDVTIAIGRVPLLEGASMSVAMGIFSSLQPQNVRLRRAIRELDTAAKHPFYPLLFDPQTAGGLLAAVPLERARACVDALHEASYAHASAIGIVTQRGSDDGPVTIDLDGSLVEPMLARFPATERSRGDASGERHYAESAF
jgi:selenide,water dikinase